MAVAAMQGADEHIRILPKDTLTQTRGIEPATLQCKDAAATTNKIHLTVYFVSFLANKLPSNHESAAKTVRKKQNYKKFYNYT